MFDNDERTHLREADNCVSKGAGPRRSKCSFYK